MKKIIINIILRTVLRLYKGDQLFYLALYHRGILNDEFMGEKLFINNVLPKILRQHQEGEYVVFDVGANKGNYSKLITQKLLSKSTMIHLFEPQQISDLEEFVHIESKRVIKKLNRYCLGASVGEIELFTNFNGSGHATTVEGVIDDLHKHNDLIKEKVKIETLSNYIIANNISHIDLLKIDTEGNEFDVLLGMGEYLNNTFVKCIQFEFNEMNVQSRVFFKDFFTLFTKKGFKIYRLTVNGLNPIKFYDTKEEIFKFQNFIAISDLISMK